MFSGKLKSYKKIDKKWNRSKKQGQDESDDDDSDAGPNVPNKYKAKNLGEQLRTLSKEEEIERQKQQKKITEEFDAKHNRNETLLEKHLREKDIKKEDKIKKDGSGRREFDRLKDLKPQRRLDRSANMLNILSEGKAGQKKKVESLNR